MKNNIIETIIEKKFAREQAKQMKNLVKDATYLANENKEFWVSYFDANGDFQQRKLDSHNYYLAFHNVIWQSLEPNEKLATLIYLEREMIADKDSKLSPKNGGKFVIGNYYEEDYFCKRENGVNTYYIDRRIFAEELIESYAFIYMLTALHAEAKSLEMLEECEKTGNVEEGFNDLVINIKNRTFRKESYYKFLLKEDLTSEEQKEVCQYLCQPLEQLDNLYFKNVEDIAFKAINRSTGLGFDDSEWKDYEKDWQDLKKDEKDLIEKVYGSNANKTQIYLNSVGQNEIQLQF